MEKIKLISLACVLALAAGTVSGCGASGKSSQAGKGDDLSKHVDISIGGINVGNSDSLEGWPTDMTKAIEKKFNVTLVTKHYDDESLNLDLSGGTTADILQVNDENLEGILKGKHAVDLTQYKGTLAKNIFADDMAFRNQVMEKFKSNGEGKLYFVTPHVASKDQKPSFGGTLAYGYGVRWDLYKAIGCPTINNDDDYVAALKKMKKLYPTTEAGLPVYAMSAYNDSGLHAYFFPGCLSQGYSNMESGLYVVDAKTNQLVPDVYDVAGQSGRETPFWASISLYRKLYQAGLLDPDCFITKGDDLTDKYTKGQYIGGMVNWFYGKYNENQRAKDPNTLKQFVVLPAYMGWANQKNQAGWQGKYLLVSAHSKNVERAVMILDYMQSKEFSRMVCSGTEGRWTEGNGSASLTEDTIDMKMNPARNKEWQKSGIGAGPFYSIIGCDDNNLAPDNDLINLWNKEDVLARSLSPADKDMCKTLGLKLPSDLLKKRVESGQSIDLSKANSAIQFGMDISPKDIVRIDSNCVQIVTNAIPGLVQAKDDASFQKAKEALIKQLKDASAEDSAKWWVNAWNKSKTQIEQMLKQQ